MAIGKLHTNPGDSWASKSTAMDIHNTREKSNRTIKSTP